MFADAGRDAAVVSGCVFVVASAGAAFPASCDLCKYVAPTMIVASNKEFTMNNLESFIIYAKPGKKSDLILNRETPISTRVFLNESTILCGPDI